MSRIELLPPPAEACLEKRYPSRQKGGTLIAADVTDLETHRQLLSDPDHYRPELCLSCRHKVLHVHDYRERTLRGEMERTIASVLRYRCANPQCRASWQILPQVIARYLHRSWPVVEATVKGEQRKNRPRVPRRTKARWKRRLRSSARRLVSALAASGPRRWIILAETMGAGASREQLVESVGLGLAALAALVHRLMPGVRIM